MNLVDSIKARSIRFKAQHYNWFKDGKCLKDLKNINIGKRCFIVGNGPSLIAKDLERLHFNGEITFAFNRIYHIFNQTNWRPTYYISQDEKMLRGCKVEVDAIQAKIKFIPAEMKWYQGIDIKRIRPFHIVNREKNGLPDFSEDISKEICNSNTVVYSAVQIAVYMGFKEIYFIGVDHHFQFSQNNKGEIIVDNTVKDYFSDDYNKDKENLYIPNVEKSTLTYIAMKKHCDERGVKVYNATRGGKLEVFPRVDFDTLF